MSPAGLQEDVLDISDPMPEVLHLYLPPIHFSPASLGVEVDQRILKSLRFEHSFQDLLLAEMSYAIASELRAQTSVGRMLADSLACSLAARLVQKYVSTSSSRLRTLSAEQGLDSRRLSRVIEYVQANLEGNLTLDELASIACLSRFHFARAFKSATGVSPHRYVSVKRLERAKTLLVGSDRSIVEIALALGFSSQANFSRAFQQLTGKAPGKFRRDLP